MKNKLAAEFGLIITAVIWGAGFIATRISAESGFGAELTLVSRFVIAALVVFVIFRKRLKNFTKVELAYGGAAGLVLFVAFYAQTIGIRFTSTSNNAFLTSVGMVIVPVLEWLVFRKRLGMKVMLAAAAAFFGVAVLTSVSGSMSLNAGDIFTLAGSFLFSCHIIVLGAAARRVETGKLLVMQLTICAVFSALCLFVFNRASLSAEINLLPALSCALYLGLFSTSLAYFIQVSAQKTASPTAVTIILSTESVFAAIFSILIGDEAFTPNLLVGGGIIILAIILLNIGNASAKKAEDAPTDARGGT